MTEQTWTVRPRVTDNDVGDIFVTYEGVRLRVYYYQNDDERRKKMLCAREYIEGWCDGHDIGHDAGYDRGHKEGSKEHS